MQFKLYLCGYIHLQELTVVHRHLEDYTSKLIISNLHFLCDLGIQSVLSLYKQKLNKLLFKS